MSDAPESGVSGEQLAQQLGLTSRQLRRIFNTALGASPKTVAQTQRLALARQLLLEGGLSMTDIALAAGFNSVRRFNAAFRNCFRMAPTQWQRTQKKYACNSAHSDSAGSIKLQLAYRPPFAWDSLLDYFRLRCVRGLEAVDTGYTRAIRIGDSSGLVRVTAELQRNRITAEFSLEVAADLSGSVRRVRDMFDLDAAPHRVHEHLSKDELLRMHVRAYPGLRIPGCWEIFELLTRAIVGQQISVQAATTILGRIVSAYGSPLGEATSRADGPQKLFPLPMDLVEQDLRHLGLNRARAETLQRVANLFADNPHFVSATTPFEDARKRLLAIKGIGPWTANYVALRGLRNPDAFPDADLGARKALGTRSAAELMKAAEKWRPWRGYALLYLWKSLED